MTASCVDMFDAITCRASVEFCTAALTGGFYATKRNPYDMTTDCPGESILDMLCYPVTR